MHLRPLHLRAIVPIALMLCAGACGLKGALYLPDNRTQPIEPAVAPPSDPSTSAAPTPETDEERATDKAPASDTQSPVSIPDPDRPTSPPPPGN